GILDRRRGRAHHFALRAISSAFCGHQAPAAGPWLQVPSDSPGGFNQKNASHSGSPVFVVGGTPTARPSALHQLHSSFLSNPVGGPLPLRPVSMMKCLPPTRADTSWPYFKRSAVHW